MRGRFASGGDAAFRKMLMRSEIFRNPHEAAMRLIQGRAGMPGIFGFDDA